MMIALLFQLAAAASQTDTPARDTALAVVSEVAEKVAALRSGYELYRRAAFNDSDQEAAAAAAAYGTSCRDLAAAARQGRRRLCRSCMEHSLQAAIDQYHGYLPSLEQFARGCATRIGALKPPPNATKARFTAIRRAVVPENPRMVKALQGYEQRVAAVRSALITSAPAPAARP
jgi:hypothetical protein